MAEEHEFINSLVSPPLTPKTYGWARVAREMDKVCGEQSAESEDSLLKVLAPQVEKIPVRAGAQYPHMFTPLGALQAQAIRTLAAWGPEHRAATAVAAFADTTESAMLESIAREYLKRLRGSKRR